MSTQPLVSVVMPVHNSAPYLREAVDSILAQSYSNLELIALDDGSTDESYSILSSYRDRRIQVLKNAENRGITYCRNLGISKGKGQYIAMLDSDDWAYPNRIATQVNYLENHADVGLLGGGVAIIDSTSQLTGTVWKFSPPPDRIPSMLLFENCLIQSTVMMRRNVLPSPPFRPEFPQAEDYDLWVRMSAKTGITVLPRIMGKYRMHTQNTSVRQASVMRQCVERIIAEQLAWLLTPSASDLQLHYLLHSHAPLSTTQLGEAEDWLKRLRIANRSAGRYAAAAFDQVLGERWYLACCSGQMSPKKRAPRFAASVLAAALPPIRRNLMLVKILFP